MAINLNNLNPEQKKAVTHDAGPLLIVAGAGTGKTTVITQRVAYLIEQKKAESNQILCLTFTDKAAGEMEERIDQLLPYGYVDLWVSTFHSFAERILKAHALEIGLPNDFKLLNQTEQWLLVRQHLDRFNLDFYKPLGNPTKFIHALLKLFSRAKDEVISPQDYLDYAESLRLNKDAADFSTDTISPEMLTGLSKKERKELIGHEIAKTQEIADAYHTYQQLLLDNNALDFADLINYCLALFKKRPAILAKYREQFKYILVDEFQDTNYAQYELVKLLAAPRNNITVVGDDDQSIYKFRGASVSNILEFKRDYPKTQELFLTKNYRSTQRILDLSYEFIKQNNPNRLEVKLAEAAAKSKSAKKILSKKLTSQIKVRGAVEHLAFETADDERRGVLEKISELKAADKKLRWDSFAILARTNDVANSFATVLRQAGVPYRFLASRGLYEKAIVQDVVAYLKLLDDYHENDAVYRILNSPVIGLPHRDLVQFNYWAKRKGYSLYASLRHPEVVTRLKSEVKQKVAQLLRWVEQHTQLAREKPVTEVVVTAMKDIGYLELLAEADTQDKVESAQFLNQLYKKMNDFEHSVPDPSVKNFLQLLELEMEAGEEGVLQQNLDDGPEAVKIMTVHASKGLEFTHVFIVSMVDRRFPTDNRPDALLLPEALIKEQLPEGDVHLQEERRLFYVAMTRAREGLYFTSAKEYGGTRKKKVSRFLKELADLGFTLTDEATTFPETVPDFEQAAPAPLDADDFKYLIPKVFSFSQLKLFEKDPKQYYLQYILKIPQVGKPFFSFGTSLHSTLQHFFEHAQDRKAIAQKDLFGTTEDTSSRLPSLKLLQELYEQYWVDDWYTSRKQHDEYKELGKIILKDFYEAYKEERPQPLALETSFKLGLLNSETNEVYTLIGKIDRVDPLDDGVEIIDYKTGAPKETLTTDDKQQLLLYQLAAERHLGYKVNKLTYYYLENNTKVSFVGSPKDLEKLEAKIVALCAQIKNADFSQFS